MTWDPFQREVLAELGHVLYRTAPLGAEPVPVDLVAPSRGSTASDPHAALVARLARAAGVSVEALPASLRDAAALARLRGDSAAKRALWPRLRALRARLQ